MKRLLLLYIFGILTFCAWSQKPANQGSSWMEEHQFGKAKTWFRTRMQQTPADGMALVGFGDACLALQQADSAEIVYRKALSLDPQNPLALVGMGKFSLLTGNRAMEIEYFDRARRADKTNPTVYGAIAEGCLTLARQDTATAAGILTLGLGVNPRYARLHYLTGLLETLRKHNGLAVNAYERSIFFAPESAVALREMGQLLLKERNFPEALTALKKSRETDPGQILVYKYLGDLYYLTEKYSEAEQSYQTYFGLAETTVEEKERMAIVLFFNKKYPEADQLLGAFTENGKNESILLRIRGYIAFETGEYQKGIDCMNRFFRLHPPEKLLPSDYIYYARMLEKTGKDSLSLVSLNKAAALDSTNRKIFEELARLATKNKWHREAAQYMQKSIRLGADRISTSFLIGKEYYFEGNQWKTRLDTLRNRGRKISIPTVDTTAIRENIRSSYSSADSLFSIVNSLNPAYAGGFLWKGRVLSLLDAEAKTEGAKVAYEKALALLLPGEKAANLKMIIECYRYLGSWHFLQYERLYSINRSKSGEMRLKSIDYFEKIHNLDPADSQASEVLQKMKK